MRQNRSSTIARACICASLVVLCVATLTVSPSALALPEGRHYELVSPSYKGGYGVSRLVGVALGGAGEGESLVFGSLGTFSGAPANNLFSTYVARRGVAGWSSEPLMVPASVAPGSSLAEVSPTLAWSLFFGSPGVSSGVSEGETLEPEFLSHRLDTPDAAPNAPEPGPYFEVAGMPLKRLDEKRLKSVSFNAASLDLCHVLFRTSVGTAEKEALLPEATDGELDLYDLATGAPGCDGESALRLVGVKNRLGPHAEPQPIARTCRTSVGAPQETEGNGFNAISQDGETIYFETNVGTPNGANCASLPGNPVQLFVRLGGARTLEVSRPLDTSKSFGGCGEEGKAGEVPGEVPCPGALARAGAFFQGANEAGTRVFFTTTASLVGSDGDTASDVYMTSIGCPSGEPECEVAKREVTSLVQISHDPNASEAAEVQNVSVVSRDGMRVYFVARGDLSGPNAEGKSPVKGADNLYVYDAEAGAGEAVEFVTDLCSGPVQSGVSEDRSCPGDLAPGGNGHFDERNDIGLWGSSREVQTSGQDGRFLVFASYAQLVAGDTDTSKDVYRYDAQSGTLVRVSVGEGGYDVNGNRDDVDAGIATIAQNAQLQNDYETSYRAVGEDGSRIVFDTADPLSPDAINGLDNAYEWHQQPGSGEGEVSLVSSGSDEEPTGGQISGGQRNEVVITPSGRDVFFRTVQGLLGEDTDGASDVYDARLGENFAPLPGEAQQCSGDACRGPLSNPAPLLVPGSVAQAVSESSTGKAVVQAKPKPAPKKAKKKKKRRKTSRRSRKAIRSGGRSKR